MTSNLWFALIGAALIALAAYTFFRQVHLLRRILAFNIMGSGVFLIMVGMAQHQRETDPVPQALVLTGIVVAVSATALALIIFRRFYSASGQVALDESHVGTADQNEQYASDIVKENVSSLQNALQSDDEAPAKKQAHKTKGDS